MEQKIRVLIAKPGLDGHDRGALVIAQALRDHGMEVIYTGLRQSPLQIVQAAIQEDVDVIGLSSLSGAHRTLFPKVVEELEKRNAGDIPVVGGGVIPSEDIPFLLEKGVRKIFTSGSSTVALAQYIQRLVHPKESTIIKPPEKIAHIGIAVHSIEHALGFYTDVLGLPLEGVEEVNAEERDFISHQVTWQPCLSLPDLGEDSEMLFEEYEDIYTEVCGVSDALAGGLQTWDGETQLDAYLCRNGLSAFLYNTHKMPEKLRHEALEEAQNWEVLFSLSSLNAANMCWWDAGYLEFLIHVEDLKKARFDNTYLNLATS